MIIYGISYITGTCWKAFESAMEMDALGSEARQGGVAGQGCMDGMWVHKCKMNAALEIGCVVVHANVLWCSWRTHEISCTSFCCP